MAPPPHTQCIHT